MQRHVRAPRQTVRHSLGQAAAGLAVVSALAAVTGAALAQPTAPAAPGPQAATTAPAETTAPAMASPPAEGGSGAVTSDSLQSTVGKDKAARIESHIAGLHSTLKITAAQEPLWQNFAAVMRQNVVQMDAVYAKRQSGYGAMNAVQDLVSYGEVEQTNAHNVQMLLPPFQALYDSFSPQQKKTADATFLRYTDKAVKKPG